MPLRKVPIVTNQIYHTFNRGINKQPIFFTRRNYQRALDTIKYYQQLNPHLPYSKYVKLSEYIKSSLIGSSNSSNNGVEIISFTLMPNHYHFLLKQIEESGINNFVRNFQISYTKYINKRLDRTGALIQGQFKAVLIEDDEQLLHVSRYIHLNPYTSFIIKDLNELKVYPWSSLPEYLGKSKKGFCSKEVILSQFKNIDYYWKFLINQSDYQSNLDRIKHLTLE